MAIKEDSIEIYLGTKTQYYEDLGYFIPRSLDKKGRWTVPRDKKISVKVGDLPESSHYIVTKICDVCGTEVPQTYDNILKKRKYDDSGDYCRLCSLKTKAQITKRNRLPFKSTLSGKFPEIAALWNSQKNSELHPDNISAFSNRKVWCKCTLCLSEYDMTIDKKTLHNLGCPYCSNYRVNETNCIATTHPELTKEWHPTKNGELTPFDITYGNGKKVWWRCSNDNCDNEWVTSPNARTSTSDIISGCPLCNTSNGERSIKEYFSRNHIAFEYQFKLNGCKLKRLLPFDFATLDKNNNLVCLIEYDGEQHYKPVPYFGGQKKFIATQKRDKIKTDYCLSNNIPLIRIPYWDFDRIEEILDNELSKTGIIVKDRQYK